MDHSAVPSEELGYFEQVPTDFLDQKKADPPLMGQYQDVKYKNESRSFQSSEKEPLKKAGKCFHESRYRAIVENSMDNIYICDAKTGKIIESNSSMQKLLGYSREEMLELSAFDFLDHTKENVRKHIGMVLEEGQLKIRDRRYRRKDGSLVDIEATCVLIKENDRELLCVVSRDVTDRIEYEKKLFEERNRAEFYLDILCHDIGNLHQGIVGFVKLYKEFQGDQGKTMECIENIDSLSMKSINLSNNLKILAGIELSSDKVVEIDLNRTIMSCLNSVKSSIPWKKPVFEFDLSENHEIIADPEIEHAFFNVIHNAVKYQFDSDPKVQITCKETGDGFIRISVSDCGSGIDLSLRSEVFNRDNLNKKHGGLGLLVVRTLVEKSGGLVWIEDRDEGQGTVVVIELPLSPYSNIQKPEEEKSLKKISNGPDGRNNLPIQYL